MLRKLSASLSALVAFLAPGVASAVTLDEAVRAAEERGVDAQLVAWRTRQTEAMRGQAWALLSPKVVANGSYTLNEFESTLDFSSMIPPEFQDFIEPTDPIVIQPKDYFSGNITIQQPLFSGEAIPTLQAAYRMTDASRADERGSRQQIRAGVAASYYGLLATREGESLAIAAAETAKSQLDLAKRQVAAESAPPRAVLQAELSLSQASREVTASRERRIQAEEAFNQLTGLPRDSDLQLPEPEPVPADLDAAIASARAGRPDILAAEARVKAAKLQSRANWVGWAPDVNGRFTYLYNENTGFIGKKTWWMMTVEAQWVLWDGGYRLAKASENGAVVHQAELYADKQRIAAESAVRTSWERYHRSEAALEAVRREQTLAEENLRLAKLGFEAGNATWLEVEQAELGLRFAKLNGVVERMNRDLAAIDLRVAVGEY